MGYQIFDDKGYGELPLHVFVCDTVCHFLFFLHWEGNHYTNKLKRVPILHKTTYCGLPYTSTKFVQPLILSEMGHFEVLVISLF